MPHADSPVLFFPPDGFFSSIAGGHLIGEKKPVNDRHTRTTQKLIGLSTLPPRNGNPAEEGESSPAERFGQWILTRRRHLGLSIAEAASRAAYPSDRWRAVEYGLLDLDETGKSIPSIGQALGIPAARLYTVLFAFIAGEEAPPPP